jgi:hypothetical protein
MRRALIVYVVGLDESRDGLLGIHSIDFHHVFKDEHPGVALKIPRVAIRPAANMDDPVAVGAYPPETGEHSYVSLIVVFPFFMAIHAGSFWHSADIT